MVHAIRLPIQTVLGLLIGSVGLLLIAVSAETLLDSGHRYASSQRVAALSAISKPLLTSLIAARVERGTIANGLLGDDPLDADSLRIITDTRQTAEAAYSRAMQGLARITAGEIAETATRLRAAHAAAAALRMRSDAAVRLPKRLRDAAILRDEPRVFQLWVDATIAASELVERAIMLSNPLVDQLLAVKRAAWTVRSHAGLIMNRSEAAVAARQPWTPAEMHAAEENRGRVLVAWSILRAAADRPDAPPAIVSAVDRAEHVFLTYFNGEARGYMDVLEADGLPDIGFAELQRRNTVAAVAAADVASTALSVMVEVAHAEMRASRTSLCVHIAALLAAIAFVAACLVILRRRVCRPLLDMALAMHRLAGREMDVAIPGSGRSDEIGAMAAAVEVFREGMRNEAALLRQQHAMQAFLDTVLEHVPAPIVVKRGDDLSYVRVNRAAEALLGVSRERLLAGGIQEAVPAHAVERVRARDVAALSATEPVVSQDELVETVHTGFRLATVTRVAIAGPDSRPQYLLTMIEDVTERRKAERRIAYLAHYDTLTDLPNRASFAQELERAVAQARAGQAGFAVMGLDLDHFKAVNDTLGHAAGDTLLRGVATRLRHCLREGDLMARIGGDEFAAILHTCVGADVAAIAARMIEAVCKPFDIDGDQVQVGLSVGIALSAPDGEPDDLMRQADAALYEAKRGGRGCCRFFDAGIAADPSPRSQDPQTLHAAILS